MQNSLSLYLKFIKKITNFTKFLKFVKIRVGTILVDFSNLFRL